MQRFKKGDIVVLTSSISTHFPVYREIVKDYKNNYVFRYPGRTEEFYTRDGSDPQMMWGWELVDPSEHASIIAKAIEEKNIIDGLSKEDLDYFQRLYPDYKAQFEFIENRRANNPA